jgi:hypothetical protein
MIPANGVLCKLPDKILLSVLYFILLNIKRGIMNDELPGLLPPSMFLD